MAKDRAAGPGARSCRPTGAQAAKVWSSFARWAIWDDHDGGGPHARVARDATLGQAVAAGRRPPTFRVWENKRALVVGRRETGLPRFDAAAVALAARGWPVVLRESGGTAVPQDSGVVNLSLVLPRSEDLRFDLESVYHALCMPIALALGELGLDVVFGEVPGAFCDGRFNLVVGGRKIAGTAQAWRNGNHVCCRSTGYVLAHASLLVEVELAPAAEIVNRFYGLAGAGGRRVSTTSATTVRQCIGGIQATRARGVLPELSRDVRKRIVEALRALRGTRVARARQSFTMER